MKKVLKISAIGLIVFALVANLHSAIFNYYGIKTNNLEGAVWAASLATTSGTTSGGGSTGGSGGSSSYGTSTFGSPVYSTVSCGTVTWSRTVFYGASGSIVGTTYIEGGIVKTSFTGNYSSSTQTSGTINARSVNYISSCPGWSGFCTYKSAVDACN